MQRLSALLMPRLPVRSCVLSASVALKLATEAVDIDHLGRLAERLACEHLPCTAAAFRLRDDAKAAHSAAPTVAVELAQGRALLQLTIASDAAPTREWTDEDVGWIDLVDLRLQELLAAADQRRVAETSRRNERLQQALYTIANLAYSELAVREMLARVHQVVAGLTYAANFFIVLYDDERDVMYFPYYADTAAVAGSDELNSEVEFAAVDYPNSLTFALLHSGQSMLGSSADLRVQRGLHHDPRLGSESVHWLGVPMLEGERVRGAVVVQSYDESRHYSEGDRALLGFVAQHTLTAVQRKQSHERLEREVQRRTIELASTNQALRDQMAERERSQQLQAALFRIAEMAGERGGLQDFYAVVHSVVSELLNARNFFISLLSDDGTELTFPYFIDQWDTPLSARRLTNGITELVLHHRKPLLATATRIHELVAAGEMVMFGTTPKCWLGVPLLLDDRAVGVMVVQSYDAEDDYGQPEQDILQFASIHIANALDRRRTQERLRLAHAELERRVEERTHELKRANEELLDQIVVREEAESRLQHKALHDSLTGLPNRASLLSRLSLVLDRFHADSSRRFAVLFLDLDRFKVVNDSVGHLLGDELLIEAGRRIAACVRAPDSVARLGGDEFTILLEDIDSEGDAREVAENLIQSMVDPIQLGDKEIFSSVSVGIALSHERYSRPEELLRDADVAMYRAKAHGRQRYEVFDEHLHQEALDMLDMESDLRRALSRSEFEPYLQPIVRLSDGVVLGYEALLRWRHASRGLLLPADFLALAEESGNIEQIDWQLYEQVFQMIDGLSEQAAYVGINVSARHFRSPDLAANLLDMIRAYAVPPWRVRIEVTEGVLLQNPEQACATMLSLREAGVLTSLDDFGTGYSSLSYLHRFPLHALKIDRSFVSDLDPALGGSSAAVVRAIRALAGSLGMDVIAEGIETESQRDALMQLDCGMGQGFLFAHPLPAQELLRRH